MAIINQEIPVRAFELIRDQIALILADELAYQATITYDDIFLAPVFTQRAKAITPEECPLINVSIDSGKYDNQTWIDSDGEYTFFVDIVTTANYNASERGDTLSSKEAQRLAGVVQGVLMHPEYVTLGFDRPFIMRAKVTGFDPGTIAKDESTNLAVVRITYVVKSTQNELTVLPTINFVTSTQVFLYETEQGFLYSGVGAPLPPPDPTCEPVEIYDSVGNLLATKASGSFYEVADSVAKLINTLSESIADFDILAEGERQITAPNSNYRVVDLDGNVLKTGSIPSNKTVDIEINIESFTYSITDSALNVLYSGNVTADLIQPISDCLVFNSDSSYTASILAEGSLSLPDITVNVENSNHTIVNSGTFPSVQDVLIAAPDGTVNIKKLADGTIHSQTVKSGSTENYEVPNNDITVNGADDFQIKATDPLNIVLTDTTSASVTPDSVTYHAGTHHVDIVVPAAAAAVDSDAQAFLTASGITDATITDAVNTFVVEAKAQGIWTDLDKIFPFVGGSSTAHSYNMKNALADGTFHGGVIHDSNGVTFNGTNGYFDTAWATNSANVYNRHYSQYLVYQSMSGVWSGSFDGANLFGMRIDAGRSLSYMGFNNLEATALVNLDRASVYCVTIDSSSVGKMYNNGNLVKTNATSIQGAPIVGTVFVGALNSSGTAAFYQNSNVRFVTTGKKLDASKQAILNHLVRLFNAMMNR